MRQRCSMSFSLNAKVKNMANSIILEIEKARATRKVPDFNPGDTVIVQVKVTEGDRERAQASQSAAGIWLTEGSDSRVISDDAISKKTGHALRSAIAHGDQHRQRSGIAPATSRVRGAHQVPG